MVAVVTGNGLGLFNSSLNILGAAAGSFGQGNLGQAGGKAWVNASTGNLILRFTDEQLSGQGQDLFHTRTYNTLGALNDADGDGWRWDGERRVVVSGTVFTAGSSLSRTTGDGRETVYTWNGSRYQSTDGDGAHDFIEFSWQDNDWYWTDGTTRSIERYNGSSGLLVSVRDTLGTLITYGYHNGKLSSVSDSSGQALIMVYNDAGQMVRLDTRTSTTGPLTSQVYYVYDGYGRLTLVRTDLTPDDNSIVDGQFYQTQYTYEGSSFRIASVVQSDGTSASFTYELVDGEYRVKTVNDASGLTTFTYVPSQGYTKVGNALNQEWVYTYDANGQLTYVRSPAENGQDFYTSFQYDADGNVIRITDNSGDAVGYYYDGRGNRILERDPQGVTVARTFSASNQILNEIHYSQPATWYGASGTWGEPPASSAQVIRHVYDYADRLRFVVSASGSVAEYRYDPNGLRTREIVYGDSRYDLSGLATEAGIAESTLMSWAAARDQTRSQVVGFHYDYRGNLIQRAVFAKVNAAGEPVLDDTTSITAYVYSQHGQLLQTVALHGATRAVLSSTTYDGMGRVLAQIDESGTRTTVHDGDNRKIAVTTASGLVLTQVYDPLGRLIRIEESTTTGATRGSSYYVYDAAGRLAMKEDATGVRTYTFYDALGRVAAEVDGNGSISRYTYNQKDQRISTLSYATQLDTRNWFSGGAVVVSLAQILPTANAADRLTRFHYDNAGRLFESIDGAGVVTSYKYDGRGQLVRQAIGQRVTRFFFDADGRQIGQLDAEGYLRENVYNPAGQLQQAIRYAAATAAGQRDAGSLADLRPSGTSLSTWSFYDGAGRQIGSVDEQGFVTETVYDEVGNTIRSIRYAVAFTAALNSASTFATVRDAVKNGASQVLITAHDGQGRVLSRTATDGSVTTFEYDAAGRLVRETTAAGTAEERSTRTLYDAFGQTTGKLLGEASGRITTGMSQAQVAAVYSQYGTTWNYDAAGRVASVTDALGNRTLSYYDAAGRLTRVINAVGEVSETKYNAFGDVIEKNQLGTRLAPGGLGGGLQSPGLESLLASIRNANIDSRTTQAWDTRGLLLTSIDAEGISTTNQYDQYGQLQRQIRVIAGSRTVTSAYGYNLRGERISQIRDAGGLNLTDTTAYDAFGRAIRSTDAAGNLSTSEYLDNGRTVVVRDPLNNSRRTELDAFGRTLKEVDTLGNVTLYSYDDVNRSIVVTMPDGTRVSTWKTRHGETLKLVNAKGDATLYEYNREGQLTRTIDALGQAEVKRYDKAGRLSESVDARGVVTHLDYDAANRVVQRSVDPTGLNQRTTYAFDTSGRQISVVDSAGTSSARVTENRYDRNGQLTRTVVDPNGLKLSTHYVYDGLGNVLRVSQGTLENPQQRVTDYVYNAAGQRRLSIDTLGYVTERTYDAAGNVLQETRYSTRYEGSRDAQSLGASGSLVGNSSEDRVTNYAYDALGRQRFSIDALGYVSERAYDSKGNVIEETRYANRYVGSRDAATLQKLGTNRLNNAVFANPGSNGLPAGWAVSSLPAGTTITVNPSNSPTVTPQDLPAGDGLVQVYQNGREGTGSYQEVFQQTLSVSAGERYAFSVYTAAINTHVEVYIAWLDVRGIWFSNTNVAQNLDEVHGGTSLGDYKRLETVGVAPEGAVGARVVIRKSDTLSGHTASQVLLAHPQFEALDPDGSASAWTRPLISSSADDRVTNYAYDALGRQRFSIDALGYVTERSYDATGNVIQEARYANRYAGSRDAATLKQLGSNLLTNANFGSSGSNGVPAGWALSTLSQTISVAVNPGNSPGLLAQDLPVGDGIVQVYQAGRDGTDTYEDLYQNTLQVRGGLRYAFSAYTGVINANAQVYISWLDARGQLIGMSQATAASQNLQQAGGGSRLKDYKRLEAIDVAPANAVTALVAIRKSDTVAGQSNSQLLVTHVQFEALGTGETTSNPWSRPLSTSADDRVTNYLHDALGRQRFSIDALGYVSERNYDAVGNVIQETRYANRYTGSRDAATLQKLGANRLNNAVFANPGSNGLPAGWAVSSLPVGTTITVNPSNSPAVTPLDLPAGDGLVQVYQNGREGTGSYQEVFQQTLSVSAGGRYAFSVYTAAINTNVEVYIAWLDASGKWFENTNVAQNLDEVHGGTSLASYKRLETIGVAPEGAVGARVVIRKSDTLAGHTASQVLLVHPQFEALDPGESTSSVWTRPLVSTSPDDRMTNYVYDALGRQRFSIDALGHVSERSYDEAGNISKETRYANTYTGTRDAATLQAVGTNLLNNAVFASPGGNGVPAGWMVYNLPAGITITVNPANSPIVTAQDLPAGDGLVQVYQDGRIGTGAEQEVFQQNLEVSAGQRYAFSVYTAAINTNVEVFIAWLDASGTWFSTSEVAKNLDEVHGGTSLADYKRLEAIGVAPAGAVSARVVIRKSDTLAGHTASQALLVHPQFEALAPGESVGSAWTRPLVSSSSEDRVSRYVYDALGRQRFAIDALGFVSERVYDGLGNVVQETRYSKALTGPRDAATPHKLETGTLKQTLSGAADRTTWNSYDASGQMVGLLDPLGYTESYTYDAFGNRTSLKNKNGQTWNYRYDRVGQLLEEITPPVMVSTVGAAGQTDTRAAMLVTRNEYNAFGNLISRSEGRLRTHLADDPALDDLGQSRTAGYGYDALGRQVRITSPGWYNKASGQFQQNSDGTANTFQVTTDVTYDSLGNAVRNRVRMNNTGSAGLDYVDSYKAYDLLGQVRYEVDALKGVTVHEYDGFGQETLTRRHAAALNAGVPASGYYQLADFTAASLPRDGVNDRSLFTRYDRLGRKTEVQQDIVSLYSFTGNVATSALKNVAPVKAYGYNSFGEVVHETLLARDISGASVMSQISTVNYYDRAGQRIGSVDAQGYYTRMEYNGSGKVARQVEYANALGAWNESSIPTVQASIRDRSVRFAYDQADRLVQTTQENVTYWQQSFAVPNAVRATMTQVTGDVIVSRSTYDGVGNVRTLTDAAGNITTTEYNALGQVQKVIEPARYSAGNGSGSPFASSAYASPIVYYAVNAFGQVVYEQRSAGEGQAGATQVTRTVYDAAGHEVKEFDAMGSAQSFKVDVAGRRLEESREINSNLSGWRYNVQTIRRTYSYDSLGQQLGASDWYTEGGVQKNTTNSVVYNRFGEITAELLNGNAKSSYVYNQVGNAIQQTNAQGVTQVDYDLTGKASRSVQLGNLATSADDRITYLRNDLLGRVLEQHLPAFEANIGSDTLNGVSLALTTPIIRQTSDRWGNVLDRTDARGYVTRYSYDHNNQVLTETLPETDILRENGTSYRASLIHEKRYDLRGLLIEEADLVSTGGGPLRTRQHAYNAAGQLVRDIDALGASRYYSVDAHGNQVGILDPVGNATFDEYDALNRHTRHGIVRNGQRVTLLTKQYDEAGRVFAEIDGASTVQETLVSTWQSNELSYLSGDTGNTRFSQFDERGNIVATRNESNIQKTFVFNEANRKVAEIDALGASLTWTYNEADYGRLVSHKDLGGRDFAYSYNGFGQTLTDGTDKVYTYHANGLLKSVATSVTVGATHYPRWYSWTTVNTSSYSYDLQGNRTRDLLTTSVSWASNVNNNGSLAYNYDTRFAFNEQGNLRGVKTPPGGMLVGDPVFEYSFAPGTIYHKSSSTMAATLTYSFDEFGNRRRSYMDTQTQAGAAVVIDDWYKYDANDRVTVVQGLQQGGQVVAGVVAGKAKGYTISYDSAGRRASSEQWVGKSGAQEKYELSEYTYNDLNQVATRRVRDIIRQSGANSSGGPQSISASQQNLSSLYDDRGRLVEQKTYANGKEQAWDFFTFRGDGQKMGEVKYTYINNAAVLAQASYFGEANMRDAVGNQLYNRYSVFNPNGTTKTRGEFRTEYAAYESYKSTKLTAWNSDAQAFGITTFENNARGELKTLLSNNNNGVLRRYVLNGDGQIALRREEAGDLAQNYLYYQGGALANTGGISAPAITDTFVPISADYPAQIPTVYQVNAGDTLQKVAQQVWGDARMWYLIADANGVTGDLVAGTALRIPNVVSSTHNTATTFKPYNANEVIGDTITQPQPPKPKGKKCNAVASVVMVVVAVVVAIFTAGAGLALAGGAGLVTAAGAGATAVMAGGIAVGGLAGFAASLGGAVVGSLASQAVGKAMGVVDQISWKQAAVAGLGGGIAAGLTGMAAGASSTIGKAFDAIGTANITWSQTALAYGVQGAAGYAGNYIASKAVGLDTSFSWKNMAASAIGSSIAGSLNADAGWAGSIFRGEVSALSSAWMKDKWFGGGRPDYGQVAADAFGNALVDFAVRSLQESSNFEAKRESDEWIRNNNDEIEERVHDKSYWLASNSDAAIELDPTVIVAEAPEGVLEQAIDYMQKSRIAEQAYLSSLVKSSTNPFGETVGRARRAINAAGYDVVDGALGIAHLVSSRTALSELATNLSTVARYVMDHPGEAINGSVAAASNYLVMTDPAQIAEDSGHFLVSALAGGAVARGATVVAGSTVRATAAGAGASMRAGVDYLKNSVYVPPPSGILYGGIFIPSLGKRITTVSKSMSRTFQGNGYLNPRDNRITAPGIGEVLAVDHIYPVSKIIDLPGFRDLTRSQMTDIIQDRVGLGNLQPLPQSLNSSKSASTKWRLYGEEKLDDDYIVNLQLEQADLENKIIRQIQIFNDLNAGRR